MKNHNYVEEFPTMLEKSDISLSLKDKEINPSIFDFDSNDDSFMHVSWME